MDSILSCLPQMSVLVVGDYFLDEYFWIDPDLAELSIETGLEAYQVVRKQSQAGAAGTVVNNLGALGVGHLVAVGLCGADGEGFELRRSLDAQHVRTSALIERADRITPTYRKPMLLQPGGAGHELNRLDSKNRDPLQPDVEDLLIERLRELVYQVQAIIIADQVQERNCGVITDRVRDALCALAAGNPEVIFLADSRTRIGEYHSVATKPNERELADLFSIDPPAHHPSEELSQSAAPAERDTTGPPGHPSPDPAGRIPLEELAAMGQELSRRTGSAVYATCGDRGMLVCTVLEVFLLPAIAIEGPVDIVGAGDSATAGIVCGLLGGLPPTGAAGLGNLVASITIRKLGTTGTASPEELRNSSGIEGSIPLPVEPGFQPRPVLGRSIEIIRREPPSPVRAAIFDFDGTLSLLREGWQDVMVPFMVGELAALHSGETARQLETTVREFVFRLTGKQTIYQMIELAAQVQRRGGQPREPEEYKQQYHDLLWRQVGERVGSVRQGHVSRDRMLVPGSLEMLEMLRRNGVALYLASGTDLDYVKDEAAVLGLQDYFQGRIYAALPHRESFSKEMVIRQILQEHSLSGPDLVAFGDGYVEIENTRDVGGRAIGVASDERVPGRLNGWKRNRLIAAGAAIIVADLTEAGALVTLLTGGS